MKFLHTSDWHLGRQFHNISLLEDQTVVLEQIVNYIENNTVDALVLAGDIYDRSVPPTAAIEVMDQFIDQIYFLHYYVLKVLIRSQEYSYEQ